MACGDCPARFKPPPSVPIRFERQRLHLQSTAQRLQPTREPSEEETRRILDGIHRINVQLGYIKPTKTPAKSSRAQAEGYFYPRPIYRPLNHMAAQLADGDIVSAEPRRSTAAAAAKQQRRLFADTIVFPVSPIFHRQHRQMLIDNNAADYFTYLNRARQQQGAPSPADISREKAMLVSTVQKIVSDIRDKDNNRTILSDNALLMGSMRRKNKPGAKPKHNSAQTSIIVVSPMNEKRLAEHHSRAVTTENITNSVKNFFTKPFKKPAAPTFLNNGATSPPSLLSMVLGTKTHKDENSAVVTAAAAEAAAAANEDDDDDDEDAAPKGPFSSYFENQKEQVVEALKQGGVIIQRLRVREGGIAIAGPNGVATAGSGGTAIVGPGGIALTHPRSLSIAGPGARVYAVPESTDLQELALRSNSRSLLKKSEGVLVATGPIVYYNPEVPVGPSV